jgi:glucarate dehydratase
MKITAVKATPVNIPLEAPMVWSVGLYPGTSKTIVQVFTDEGLTGLGEAPSWDCAHLIEKDLAPRLLGQDPVDIAGCEACCVPEWRIVQNTDDASVVKAFGGIEMALWDIRGKAWGRPLYQLLGGAVRKQIPFTEYFAFRAMHDGKGGEQTPEAVLDHCLKMKETYGSTLFEGKLTLGDPDLEIATLKLLRKGLGDRAMLRMDGNMAWSYPTALRILKAIEPLDIRNYEDPVATFEEMAALRRHVSIPFSTHVPLIRYASTLGGIPEAFVTNFAVLGGINRAVKFISACEAMGFDFWCYSGDAGIASAAYLHVVAACQWIREPSQSLFRWQTDDVIDQGPFKPVNNLVAVPEGPGLGISLDENALKRCHKRFLDQGPVNHFMPLFPSPSRSGKYARLPLS